MPGGSDPNGLPLQKVLRDLVALSAVPSVWVGRESRTIAADLADLLATLLNLDFAFVRLRDFDGNGAVEVSRGTASPTLLERLQHYPDGGGRLSQPEIVVGPGNGVGGGAGLVLPLGVNAEVGLAAAACDRPDFPSEIDQLLLSVAACHGVTAFKMARLVEERQRAVTALTTSERQLRQARDELYGHVQLRVNMLQHIPVAAWSIKPDGTLDAVNQLWFEHTGQTPESVTSHPEAWMASVHPEDRERALRAYWEGIRSGRGYTVESRLLRASDGTYRWHLHRAVPVRDPEGNILRFVGTSTDVHDLRQAQEALRNTQAEFAHMTRVMTIGELTASIAHEVNQPLGAIVTSAAAGARWLATKPPQMDKARRALERIANDGKRAAEVIRRIRALMKRQAPRKEWLDINETILEVIALAQYQLRRSEILVETQLGHDLPLVRCDRVQLQQVLLNLIINAIEAMSGNKERPRELTIVSASDGPDTVSVEVRDSGTGLDPEHAPHLFEPFYTTKAVGLGIGLSISRSIVEAHGGRLSAAANAPYGTVFSVSLPVNELAP
jgi:PAS domain S-box-containing protein